jgi:hypothetical protein
LSNIFNKLPSSIYINNCQKNEISREYYLTEEENEITSNEK